MPEVFSLKEKRRARSLKEAEGRLNEREARSADREKTSGFNGRSTDLAAIVFRCFTFGNRMFALIGRRESVDIKCNVIGPL